MKSITYGWLTKNCRVDFKVNLTYNDQMNLPLPPLKRPKIVFLDLEETVIDDFTLGYGANAVRHPQVRAFLEKEAADEVRIFSFALQSNGDVLQYRGMFHRWLTAALGTAIKDEPLFTTEQLYELCLANHLHFDSVGECQRYHGKQYGFEKYVEFSPEFSSMDLVLLDDAVTSGVVELPERSLSLRFVNVKELDLQ